MILLIYLNANVKATTFYLIKRNVDRGGERLLEGSRQIYQIDCRRYFEALTSRARADRNKEETTRGQQERKGKRRERRIRRGRGREALTFGYR